MVTCCVCIELLAGYLAEELSARQRAQCRWHLGWCPDCTAYLQNYQATIVLGRAAFISPEVAIPLETQEEEFVQTILSTLSVHT